MKVISAGSLTRTVTCKRCSSALEYEPEDVKVTTYEESAPHYDVQCPICLPRLGASYAFIRVPPPGSDQ